MKATVLKPIRVKSTGETFLPGAVVDREREKIEAWAEKGLVRIKTDQAFPQSVEWESPLFGKLSGGPVLSMTETTFTLVHPLTGEKVTLSKEWLVTMDERSAIMEFDAGLPHEEADKRARGMMFNQFRKGA